MSLFKIYFSPSVATLNCIATLAIGEDFLKKWEQYALPSWLDYCKKYNIQLICITDFIDYSKGAYWQKLLIGNVVKQNLPNIQNIMFLDTDILISPLAPNVFKLYEAEKIAVVEEYSNIFPQKNYFLLKNIAYFRHHFISSKYPLDSSLFAPISRQFADEGYLLPKNGKIFCSGVLIFNIKHISLFNLWYEEIHYTGVFDHGEQLFLNYKVSQYGNVQWLDYKFQTHWINEMAEKYSFLYQAYKNMDKTSFNQLAASCIQTSLKNSYFLHFPGSWIEGRMWENKKIFSQNFKETMKGFKTYLKKNRQEILLVG